LRERIGQCESSGHGDKPSHAAPAYEEGLANGGRFRPAFCIRPPRFQTIGTDHDQQARAHHGYNNESGESQCFAQMRRLHAPDDRPRLHPHQQESEHVQREDNRTPDGERVHPHTSIEYIAVVCARKCHGEGDQAQHGGQMEMIGHDPDQVSDHELK
jgi:hypothetical protein